MITEPSTPELLTIQQVADRVGLTRQAIYPRLDRDLSEFYAEVDGRKMLKSTVVEYILSKFESKADSKIDDKDDIRLLDALQAEIEILRQQNATLAAQIAVKDAQLAASDERLHEANSIGMSSLNLSERQQQLYLAAIAEPPEPEPPASTPKKRGLLSRIRDRLKST